MKRYTDIDCLVDEMLDRLEAKGAGTRLLAYPGAFSSIGEEDAFMARLNILERQGGVTVKRARVDGVDLVQHVRLADPGQLYTYRRRKPATLMSTDALATLRADAAVTAKIAEILDEIGSAWSRRVAWGGLMPGAAEDLSSAVKMANALNAVQLDPRLASDYRTFSRRAVGDSKFLERRIGLVLAIFRRAYLDQAANTELEDPDLLGTLGIQRMPQPLLVGGRLLVDHTELPAMPFFGLAPDQSSRLSVCNPSYVLTIENYASFVRHCREVNADGSGLVIYTGGFPGRQILKAAMELVGSASCPIYHWGDLDRGGLGIFTHLERAFLSIGRALKPHLMDREVLVENGTASAALLEHPPAFVSGSAVEDLWSFMASAEPQISLEQEALDPRLPE